MSDKANDEESTEKPFYVDRAKTGRAGCRKCKHKIAQGELRLGKLAYNPFGSGTVKQWHHVSCMFEVFKRQRATTKRIEHPEEVGGWLDLNDDDRREIMSNFSPEVKKVFETYWIEHEKIRDSPEKKAKKPKEEGRDKQNTRCHKDNTLKMFRKLCADIASNSSYLNKTKVIADFFDKGSDGKGFKSDVELWCRLLLPGVVQRVYNLQSKQIVKLFSKIFDTCQEEMLEDLEKGDVAETISEFFKKSKTIQVADKSTLTLQEVDEFLNVLSELTKEDQQIHHFRGITKKCTANDLKMIIRLIKQDLRINAGPKHVLEALHEDAYEAFQTSRDITSVVRNAVEVKSKKENESCRGGMDIDITVMTPMLPMLAQPCKSVEMALEKCPNGMFSEVKYDGERVQVHKKGDTFKYFSRSLKPVLGHKVNHFKDYIPRAFPHGEDLVLDAEILMVDNASGKPLPFGTLGIHKKSQFSDANVCLFVFDCMYYNGKSLLKVPISERKEILRKNMVEVKNRIMFSEMEVIHKGKELERMMTNVFLQGLEGLVLKDKNSIYEPGKRHWLKIKRDYLGDGAMADSADLVVLGAWFGTGSKGGLMSSFLMGCYNPRTKKWVTVTRVANGHDDDTLDRIQRELDVVKIGKDSSRLPSWLSCTKTMVPDLVASDPKKMPVWEITGAEFTRNQVHTADGISIRFPRVTRIRSDKDWSTATDLNELKNLYERSRDTSRFTLIKDKSPSPESSADEKSPEKHGKRKKTFVEKNRRKKAKKKETETEDYEFSESNLSNPLPNIFTGCVVQLPKGCKNYQLLRRYLIAYDGRLYDSDRRALVENSREEVTHVVHLTRSITVKREPFWSATVRHVHINWLWNSVKLLERQSESVHRVSAKKTSPN